MFLRYSRVEYKDATRDKEMKAGESLARIRAESGSEVDKGRRFEELFMRLAWRSREFEIERYLAVV